MNPLSIPRLAAKAPTCTCGCRAMLTMDSDGPPNPRYECLNCRKVYPVEEGR